MRVAKPDLELFLTGYFRTVLRIEGHDVQVGNKEPPDLGKVLPLTRPIVVVRDDSGPQKSRISFDHQVGVSVLAGTRILDKSANDLARLVMAIATDEEIIRVAGSPIAAITFEDCNGPYAVPEDHDVSRRYMTVGYTVVGSW